MASISFRFAGFACLDARQLIRDLERQAELEQFEDRQEAIDKFIKPDLRLCNSFTYVRGRHSSVGKVLMLKRDLDAIGKIQDAQDCRFALEITEGSNELKFQRLGIVHTQALIPNPDSLPTTPYIVTLGDGRKDAEYAAANKTYNWYQIDGKEVTSTFLSNRDNRSDSDVSEWNVKEILGELWKELKPHFGMDLSFKVGHGQLQSLSFVGMPAWEAFWMILDIAGWEFRIRMDGVPEIFELKQEPPENVPSGELFDADMWNEAPRLPAKITAFAPSRDWQWQQDRDTHTARDYHQIKPAYAKAFDVKDLLAVGNSAKRFEWLDTATIVPSVEGTAHIWGTLPLVTNDRGQKVNQDSVDSQLKALAKRYAFRLLSYRRQTGFSFRGLRKLFPSSRFGTVIFRQKDFGMTTTLTTAEVEPVGSRWTPIQPRQYAPHEPYTRLARVRVQRSLESSTSAGEPSTNVPQGSFCNAFIQSGLVNGDQVVWSDEHYVRAVNDTGGSIEVGATGFAYWNYQLGRGGEWVITSASGGEEGEHDCNCNECDPCTLAIIAVLKQIMENLGLQDCVDFSALSEICGCEPSSDPEPSNVGCDEKCSEGFPEHVWVKMEGATINIDTAVILPHTIQREMLAWFNKVWTFSYGGRGSDCEGRMSPMFAKDRDCGGRWVRQWTFRTLPIPGVPVSFELTTITLEFWISRVNADTWHVGLWRWFEPHNGPLGENRDECGRPTTKNGEEIALWAIKTSDRDCHGQYTINSAQLIRNAGFHFNVEKVTGYISGRPPGLGRIDFVSQLLGVPSNAPAGSPLVAGETTRFAFQPKATLTGSFSNVASIEVKNGAVAAVQDSDGNTYRGPYPPQIPDVFLPCSEMGGGGSSGGGSGGEDPSMPQMPSAGDDPNCTDVGPNAGNRCIWDAENDDPGFDVWQ